MIGVMMAAMAESRGEVGRGVEIPPAMQAIVDRMSVEKLLAQAGNVSPEQFGALNAQLNRIPK